MQGLQSEGTTCRWTVTQTSCFFILPTKRKFQKLTLFGLSKLLMEKTLDKRIEDIFQVVVILSLNQKDYFSSYITALY